MGCKREFESEFYCLMGKRIKQTRKNSGLLVKQIAHRIGVSQGQYYKYESGLNVISIHTLLLIAREIEQPIELLLGGLMALAQPPRRSEKIPEKIAA